MRLYELFLKEMPVKISPLGSNLGEDLPNKTEIELVDLFHADGNTIYKDDNKRIIHSDTRVWAIEKIKNKERLTYKSWIEQYYPCYVGKEKLGKCFKQKFLWKDNKSTFDGIAITTVFDIYLKEYDTMVSDNNQTAQGIKWWKKLLSVANNKGFTIGFMDCDKDIIDIFDGNNIEDWIKSKKAYTGHTAKDKTFFITKKNITV